MCHDFKEYSDEKKRRIIAHHAVCGVIIHLMLVWAFLCGWAAACCHKEGLKDKL